MMVFLHFSFAIVAILGFTLRKGVNIEKSIAIQNVGHTLCDGVIVLYGTLKSRSISETALSSTLEYFVIRTVSNKVLYRILERR